MSRELDRVDRRRVIQALGATGIVAIAGCVGDDDEPVDEDDDAVEEDDDDVEEEEEEEVEEEEVEEEEEDVDTLQALIALFDDEPFNEAQFEVEGENRNYTPHHVWKWVSDETFIALHVDEPNPEEAENLLYVVVGQKGAFTEESQPAEEFSHFHSYEADGWEAGHGGGGDGYWLTHMAVDDFEMPWGDVEVGVDYDFMPTPPEEEEGTAEFEVGGEGSLSDEDRDTLIELFDDNWTNDDQREIEGEMRNYTPHHVWWEVSDDVLLFLHFDEPNPEEAEDLIYFGMGQAGNFVAEDNPQADDFSHFHMAEADSWEAGHGGEDEDSEGYWLIHHAVRDLEMPWGDVDVGVDRDFMPIPVED